MMNLDREPIAFGQLALSGSLLAFALLIYLVSFGGPSQHLAELCVLALSFGALKTRRVEIKDAVESVALDHQSISNPRFPTLRVQAMTASLKSVALPVPMPRVVWAPPAVVSATGQPTELELPETFAGEAMRSTAPPANTISEEVLPIETVPVNSLSFERRLYAQEVDEIARRHANKFKFMLSPLVYGPEAEVIPIINACFPADSIVDVTSRCREIILLGREQYALVHSACSQKKFVGAVIDAHSSMRIASHHAKLNVSYHLFCGTLTGRNSSLGLRLATPMPVANDAQLILL